MSETDSLYSDEGAIYAMGWGADGQLGLGTSSDANVPTRQSTPLGANVKKLAGSTDFTLALTGSCLMHRFTCKMQMTDISFISFFFSQRMESSGPGAIPSMDKA